MRGAVSPKVSIIIPVWNGEKYLGEAIESALAQEYQDKEVIVVNDGSTDQTHLVMAKFGDRVRCLHQENRGLGASRNAGIQVSTGTYLAFLDHDDLWEKTKLSQQVETVLLDGKDPLLLSHVKQFLCPTLTEEEKSRIRIDTAEQPGYFAGTLLLSRDRFEEIGYFVEEKILGEFIEWYLRVTEKKIPTLMLEETMLYRRIHQENMGRQKERYSRTDYLKILKASLARRRGIEIP